MCRVTSVVTVLLCGRTRDSVVGLKQSTSRALTQLKSLLRDNVVLPGGGYSEVSCAQALSHEPTRDRQSTLQSSSSWMASLVDRSRPDVYRVVSEGLLHFAATVVQNCSPGLSVYDAHCQVKKMQTVKPQFEVLDQLSSKIHCLSCACELVKLLLNTHSV